MYCCPSLPIQSQSLKTHTRRSSSFFLGLCLFNGDSLGRGLLMILLQHSTNISQEDIPTESKHVKHTKSHSLQNGQGEGSFLKSFSWASEAVRCDFANALCIYAFLNLRIEMTTSEAVRSESVSFTWYAVRLGTTKSGSPAFFRTHPRIQIVVTISLLRRLLLGQSLTYPTGS